MEKDTLLISFSGGETSGMMAKHLYDSTDHNKTEVIIIFCNTGKERIETLNFVHQCDIRWFNNSIIWLEANVYHDQKKSSGHKLVTYQTASRHGEPFEEVIKKYGIPNIAFPHCTRELKLNPIKSFMNDSGYKDYITAIGIRFDEPRRIRQDSKLIYPLYDLGVTKQSVRNFWDAQDFKLGLKSHEGNCDFCWKKSVRKKLTLYKENPSIIDWWREMEDKYSENEFFFHRENISTASLVTTDQIEFKFDLDEEKPCTCRTNLEDL